METKYRGVYKQNRSGQLLERKAPGISLPHEKLSDEELAKLSSPVRKYHISELSK